MKILYIEDSELQISLAKRVVRDCLNCSLVAARTRDEALQAIAKNLDIDLIVTDFYLNTDRRVNGLDIAKMVKMLDIKIPVVLLTGRITDSMKEGDLSLFDSYHEKDDLLKCWRNIVKKYLKA